MDLGDREFTSEEVAELCGVTRVTVADWIARGRLAVRWTSGGHRRIPRESLCGFMSQQGYAVPRMVQTARASVIVLDRDAERGRVIAAAFAPAAQFDVEVFAPGSAALVAIGSRRPDVVAFSTRVPGFDAPQLIDAVREHPATRQVALIAVMPRDDDGSTWRRLGVDIVSSLDRLGDLRATAIQWLTENQRRVSDETEDADRSGVRPVAGKAAIPARAQSSE